MRIRTFTPKARLYCSKGMLGFGSNNQLYGIIYKHFNRTMKRIITFVCFAALLFNVHAQENAQWITAGESQSATNTWLSFRKDFKVDTIAEKVIARIAVDSKYWLWINGEMVVFEGGAKRGPNPTDTYFDELDLARYLKKGQNSVAILLWYFGKEGFSHNSSGKAGLFFDAKGDNGFRLTSDKTWKARIHPAYFTPGPPVPNFRLSESNIGFDARVDIKKWTEQSYKGASSWPSTKVCGAEGAAPWNSLRHRIIPLWKDFGLKDYTKTELKSGILVDTLVCWLPYNAQITPYLKVESESGDRIVLMTDNYQGGGPYNVRAEFIAAKGLQTYESFGWMNGHRVWYIVPKTTKVIEVKYRETAYNTEVTGVFNCNDPFFNTLWTKACRTLLVTMRDTYMDCPDRERSQWWGDEVNESGEAFFALNPQSALLMKKGMYELIGWQKKDGSLFSPIPSSNWDMELPEQMLAAIGQYGFWNYYLNTGDKKPMEDLYEGVLRYLKVWEINADGSIKFRKTAWNWGDWGTNIDKEGLYNAWYYLALKGAKNMAVLLRKESDAMEMERKMMRLKEAFNANFWNGNAYRHPGYKENTDDRLQALAVVSGLADNDKYAAIFEVLKTQEYASPYMEKYVTEALFMMGYGTYGLQRMKKRFSEMVNNTYYTTLYEGWGIGANGFGGGSTNHAWSGGGLTILAQYVCGVAPVDAGFSTFSVLPQPAGLENASLKMLSVKGTIEVKFNVEKKVFNLHITAPENTQVIAGVPRQGVKTIRCNKKIIWQAGKFKQPNGIETMNDHSNFITFKLPAGDWAIVATN